MLWQPNGLTQTGQSWRRPQGGGASAAYTNFIARTSGLDATHLAAYQALLDGLTTDGLFNSDGTSDYFDVLYLYATQDQTTALLNLPNNTFAGTNVGALTFTADVGFVGDTVSDHYINLGFNPQTATAPKYTQDSAHVSIWNLLNGTGVNAMSFVLSTAGTNIYPKYTDNNIYLRVNDDPESGGFAVSDPRGHILGNRSSSTARQGYLNNASVGSYGSQASVNPTNSSMSVCGSFSSGSVWPIAMASAGGSLDSVRTQFYTRLRTYMTAVGVP